VPCPPWGRLLFSKSSLEKSHPVLRLAESLRDEVVEDPSGSSTLMAHEGDISNIKNLLSIGYVFSSLLVICRCF
jgi:hypothetical protein